VGGFVGYFDYIDLAYAGMNDTVTIRSYRSDTVIPGRKRRRRWHAPDPIDCKDLSNTVVSKIIFISKKYIFTI
jgi:hypothetical protein